MPQQPPLNCCKFEERSASLDTPRKRCPYGVGEHQFERTVEREVADEDRRHGCNPKRTLHQRSPWVRINRGGRRHSDASE